MKGCVKNQSTYNGTVKNYQIFLTPDEIEKLGTVTLEGTLYHMTESGNLHGIDRLVLDIKGLTPFNMDHGKGSCDIEISDSAYRNLQSLGRINEEYQPFYKPKVVVNIENIEQSTRITLIKKLEDLQ